MGLGRDDHVGPDQLRDGSKVGSSIVMKREWSKRIEKDDREDVPARRSGLTHFERGRDDN